MTKKTTGKTKTKTPKKRGPKPMRKDLKKYIPSQSKFRTPDKLGLFLMHLMGTGQVLRACRLARIDPKTIYTKKRDDQKFKAAFDEAMDIAVDMAESEAFRRAIEGTLKPVFQGGKKVGSIREFSDGLLSMILKARRKELYGDNFKLSGDPDAPLQYDDLGRSNAMAEIAAIFAGLGLKAPFDPRAGAGGVEEPVAGVAGAANTGPGK